MGELRVECYAGYKGEQYPQRFYLGGQIFEVIEIEDQWYSPSSQYFKVRAGDGNIYILKHEQDLHSWTLDAFRKTS